VVDQTNEGQEDGLSRGSLDDGGLANTSRVQVDVCTFFRCFLGDVEIQYLDNVADEIRELSASC
jgi:hypothetical protein